MKTKIYTAWLKAMQKESTTQQFYAEASMEELQALLRELTDISPPIIIDEIKKVILARTMNTNRMNNGLPPRYDIARQGLKPLNKKKIKSVCSLCGEKTFWKTLKLLGHCNECHKKLQALK